MVSLKYCVYSHDLVSGYKQQNKQIDKTQIKQKINH